eukprot:tig00000269_g23778.t1
MDLENESGSDDEEPRRRSFKKGDKSVYGFKFDDSSEDARYMAAILEYERRELVTKKKKGKAAGSDDEAAGQDAGGEDEAGGRKGRKATARSAEGATRTKRGTVRKQGTGLGSAVVDGATGEALERRPVTRSMQTYEKPPSLRIIAGTAKGVKLVSPDFYLRPMMSKVRAALFSMLYDLGALDGGGRVLDCFAGSGSVGIEALSRGMEEACFIDADQRAVDVIGRNLKKCRLEGRGRAYCYRVDQILKRPELLGRNREPFRLVSFTPPYEEVSYAELADGIARSPLIGPGSVVSFEYPYEMGAMPQVLGDCLVGVRDRRYGRTKLALYVYGNPDELLAAYGPEGEGEGEEEEDEEGEDEDE